jgi:heme exporter protein C
MRDMNILKYFIGLLFCAVIVLSFVSQKPVAGYGEEFRIFYYHVPAAIVSFIAFGVNLFYSIKFLRSKKYLDDLKAASAAELGIILAILATLTGSIFSKITWGAYWNWDIRQTSIVVLIAIYGAYFALRGAIDVEERRAAFSSVYSILAFIAVPTFGFIIPRLYQSLHPSNTLVSGGKMALGGIVMVIFFMSILAFLLLFLWLFNLRWRISLLERIKLEKGYE